MLRLSSTVSQCLSHHCCRFNIRTSQTLNHLINKERMAVWDRKISCCFTLLLAGALGLSVNYPGPVCGVKGSIVTLPCSFTPLKTVVDDVGERLIEVVRVIWCKGPDICGTDAQSVYDSKLLNNNPRYRYLGDKKGDCTLQISDLQKKDDTTFCFRMETNDPRASFIGQPGVSVTVADALGQCVNYPDPVCGVKGSTVILPCSFTPLKSVMDDNGREVLIKINRVVWCKNHLFCHGTTPTVYDSESNNNDPRYRYLGDKKRNCTLQISDLQEKDDATFRFRMEADDPRASFTDRSGVRVTVVDGDQMKIRSSRDDGEFKRREAVSLNCSAAICTIHQLEVTWFRDGHALSESGPALHLGYLTAKDSGIYTCGLKRNNRTLSVPYSLHVGAEEEGTKAFDPLLAVRLLLFTLHTVLIVIVTAIIIKRTCVRKKKMMV